ncbi:MAG: parallel beta-helix domain-containing protein [Parvularculaceae bacterium]
MNKLLLLTSAAVAIVACGKKDAAPAPSRPFEETLQERLLDAKSGDVIEIPEGTFRFDRSLSLAVDGVTLRGKGMDKSILSFKGQKQGAEGLLVTADDFTIEDVAIEDTKGDALKVNEGENIVIRRVRTEWTGGPKTENGAYGIYPVQTRNVLIEGSVAIGASDAGIYVGQSKNVVVRNNTAERNVAGIEIENTFDADVFDNVATGNTGGILVFNMPNLKQPGARTRIFRNRVSENNHPNFGLAGTAVGNVPAGSGIIVQSNDQVEIFDNDIVGNKTGSVLIASIFSSGLSTDGMAADFDGYPEAVYVYANRMSGGGTNPGDEQLAALKAAVFGPEGALPDVLWDGVIDPAKQIDGATPANLRICVEGAEVFSINPAKPGVVTADLACALEKLPAVALAAPLN